MDVPPNRELPVWPNGDDVDPKGLLGWLPPKGEAVAVAPKGFGVDGAPKGEGDEPPKAAQKTHTHHTVRSCISRLPCVDNEFHRVFVRNLIPPFEDCSYKVLME